MYCSTCGKEISNTAGFCKHCVSAESNTLPKVVNDTAPQLDVTQPFIAAPPIMPSLQQPKKKLHWLWKDRIARVVCSFLVVVLIIPAIRLLNANKISDPDAVAILNATHPFTTTTYEEAFDRFFENPKWKFIGPDEAGGVCVEFTGKCLYNDVKGDALIQITIDKESREIWCNYASFNDVSQSLLIANELIDKIFEPYFIPELIEAAQQKVELEMDATIDKLGDELQSNLEENIKKAFTDKVTSSSEAPSEGSVPALSPSESATPQEYPPVWTNDLVAIDYIGMTLGEVITLHGTDFILPEYGWDGARYLYYDNGPPYMFFFQPYENTPSDEDVIISVRTNGPGAWIANYLPVPDSQEELRYRLGMPADADTDHFIIDNCDIIITRESPAEPISYVTIKGQLVGGQ